MYCLSLQGNFQLRFRFASIAEGVIAIAAEYFVDNFLVVFSGHCDFPVGF